MEPEYTEHGDPIYRHQNSPSGFTPPDMSLKRPFHEAQLGIVLGLLILPILLSWLILIGAVGHACTKGFEANHAALIVLYLFPTFLGIAGWKILRRLKQDYSSATRKRLLVFYIILLGYGGLWVTASTGRDDTVSLIFSVPQALIFIGIGTYLALSVVFSKADKE